MILKLNPVKWMKWTLAVTTATVLLLYLTIFVAMKMTASGVGFPNEAHDAIYAESKETHQLKLIDSGLVSLYDRLNLIASAKESLELEFFIFNKFYDDIFFWTYL